MDRRGRAWAASGAMELTGWSDGPALGGPPALVDLVERAAGVVDRRSEGRAAVDGLALLGERAALGNLTRQGRVSCGGSTRLVRTADSWLAVSLARPDDVVRPGGLAVCRRAPRGPLAGRGADRRGSRTPPHSMRGPHCSASPSPPSPLWGLRPPPPSGSPSVRRACTRPPARHVPSKASGWSTCPPCGPGRCAGSSSPRRGRRWSRSSRWRGPTAPAGGRRPSST